MPDFYHFVIILAASFAAGAVNAIAGGGTLISFPMLTVIGIPAVTANITNTVALSPGYLSAAFAQKRDLKGQGKRLKLLLPFAVFGGIAGGILLLNTGEKLFRELVPYLILLACILLAFQEPLRKKLNSKTENNKYSFEKAALLPVTAASVYGGYFGAGVSVIILAALGITINDNLTRLNALKQAISFAVNIAAAIFFLFSGKVIWNVAFIMAVGAIIGGIAGGKLVRKIKPSVLRIVVISIGIIVSIFYF